MTSHERDVPDSAWLTPSQREDLEGSWNSNYRQELEDIYAHARVADDVIQELTTALQLLLIEWPYASAAQKALERVDQLGKKET